MIVGTGIDIVEKDRIGQILDKYGNRFIKKVLSQNEMGDYHSAACKKSFVAKRFAAKEACVKALGTGFAQGIILNDISIENDKNGKPSIKFNQKINRLFPDIDTTIRHLSISDEREYACAVVILERV